MIYCKGWCVYAYHALHQDTLHHSYYSTQITLVCDSIVTYWYHHCTMHACAIDALCNIPFMKGACMCHMTVCVVYSSVLNILNTMMDGIRVICGPSLLVAIRTFVFRATYIKCNIHIMSTSGDALIGLHQEWCILLCSQGYSTVACWAW